MKVVNEQLLDQITIVEYDPSYAALVAEMWNNSKDGWGGGNTVMSEDQVLKQEANSTNLHLFLALDSEKVVGYCSLGEYREDEGALYIPLLNVRDDYHGKKIGKKLVLKALERAVELKWPRLDLYTWPGNTKAVPLYKKCGFFWEERDDTTHLMNFLPTVLNTEAVQDFFNAENWYDTSSRVIEVKPDGMKENDFHYYQYSWQNTKQEMLKMEFERFGRGLRLIETDDYLISATVDDFNLVFGSEYNVRYQFINKSGKPLNIKIEGMDDKNIQFHASKKVAIEKDQTIEIPFKVNPIEEEQSVWRTHPSVNAMLTINGKKAMFKVGIRPKFPVNLSCKSGEQLTFLKTSSVFYIDLENNFNEEATFSFDLPSTDLLKLEQQQYNVTLNPKAKVSIPVRYMLLKHGFYSAGLKITATKTDGSIVPFSKRIGVAFRGIGSKFSGESDAYYHVYNGQYHLKLDKFNNWIAPGKGNHDFKLSIMYPKLGKPFSEELSRLRPEKVEMSMEEGYAGLKATYSSKAFPGVQLSSIVKLFSEGLVEYHYEIKNLSPMETTEEIWFNNPILCRLLDRAVLPYQNEYLELNDSLGSFLSYWNGNHLTENWIFLKGQNDPRGISWSEGDKIHFASWFMYFEHNFGKLRANESVETKPVTFSLGAFHDWQTFRAFAIQNQDKAAPHATDHMAFSVNDHNPFVDGTNIKAAVKDYKSSFFNGMIEIKMDQDILQSHIFTSNEEIAKADFEIQLPENKEVHVITSKMNLDAIDITRQTAAFVKKDIPVSFEKSLHNEIDIFSVDNGVIRISAAPEFSPSLYSVQYNNQEWMHSSFPKPEPKSWWNPWFGGIASILDGMSLNSMLKEKSEAAFTERKDSKGNEWKGIKLTTRFQEHETYKGLEVHHYFLLLPGVPVLCHTAEIVQNTASYIDAKNFYTGCFLNSGTEMTKNWASFQNEAGDWSMVYGGKGENEMNIDRSIVFGSDEHEQLLQVIANRNLTIMDSYINKEILELGYMEKLSLSHGERHMTSPVFYLFNNAVIPENALEDLKKITFSL